MGEQKIGKNTGLLARVQIPRKRTKDLTSCKKGYKPPEERTKGPILQILLT